MSNANLNGLSWGWSGIAVSPSGGVYQLANGGENQYFNPSAWIDLSQDDPRWTCLQRSITESEFVNDTNMANGSPCGRHLYDSQHFFPGSCFADGKDRIMLFAYHAGSAPIEPPLSGASQRGAVDGWRIVDGAWDAPATWLATTSTGLTGQSPPYIAVGANTAQAADPTTGKWYSIATGGVARKLVTWSSATNTYDTPLTTSPTYPETGWDTNGIGGSLAGVEIPGAFDPVDNSFVVITDASALQSTNVVTGVTTNVPLDRYMYMYDGGLCYDPDNDRFIAAPASDSFRVYAVSRLGETTLLGTYATPADSGGGPRNRLRYCSGLRGVVILPDQSNGNVHFMPTL